MSIDVKFDWHLDEFEAELDRRVQQIVFVTPQQLQDAAETIAMFTESELAIHAHPPGTKTPSPPGEPPGTITGRLANSVRRRGSLGTATASWSIKVGPTAVYSRIQELGGRTGKGHKTYLPPRPYFRKAVNDAADAFAFLIKNAWKNAWSGRGR